MPTPSEIALLFIANGQEKTYLNKNKDEKTLYLGAYFKQNRCESCTYSTAHYQAIERKIITNCR
jgi:hypothetical protein